MTCYKCGSTHVIRNGHTPTGDQKFLCKSCGRSFKIAAARDIGFDEGTYRKKNKSFDSSTAPISSENPSMIMSSKSTPIAFLLLMLTIFGIAGMHRFYVGKIKSGILYLLTLGFFGIGSIVDIIKMQRGTFTDKDGKPLQKAQKK